MPTQRKDFVAPSDPILIQKAEKIIPKEVGSKKNRRIIEQLLDIAFGEQKDRKKAVLVGLAAPQVGVSKQIILVDVGADGRGKVSDLKVYINPKITWSSKEKENWYEGCYSTDRVCGIVSRPKSIKIKALTRDGKIIEEKHHSYIARIFQHEIDHLDGIEFVAHIKDNNKLHWVEENEFPKYRDKQGWKNWPHKCSREKWEKIKGIKSQNK